MRALMFLIEEGKALLRAVGVIAWMSLFMVGVWVLVVAAS